MIFPPNTLRAKYKEVTKQGCDSPLLFLESILVWCFYFSAILEKVHYSLNRSVQPTYFLRNKGQITCRILLGIRFQNYQKAISVRHQKHNCFHWHEHDENKMPRTVCALWTMVCKNITHAVFWPPAKKSKVTLQASQSYWCLWF